MRKSKRRAGGPSRAANGSRTLAVWGEGAGKSKDVGTPGRSPRASESARESGRRAGLARAVSPHQLRHASGSNVADAGGTIDEIQDLLGHMSMSSSQVYLHPDPARLRAAVDRVPSPRELAGMPR